MKANELMIGDYVNVTGKEGLHSVDILDLLPRIGKVIGLDEEIVYVDYIDYAFSLGDVEPIRINDDILSLNGWERTGGASHRIYGDYNAVIFHWNENRKEIIIDKNGDRHYMLKLDLLYVHELQHALRICGIDKEIIIKKED